MDDFKPRRGPKAREPEKPKDEIAEPQETQPDDDAGWLELDGGDGGVWREPLTGA